MNGDLEKEKKNDFLFSFIKFMGKVKFFLKYIDANFLWFYFLNSCEMSLVKINFFRLVMNCEEQMANNNFGYKLIAISK